MKEGRF